MADFGTRLKAARKDKKMTQKALADRLGVEQSTVSNYENNFRFPVASALREIAEQLNVSVDYLLSGSEFQESNSKPETSQEVSGEFLSNQDNDSHPISSELIKNLNKLQTEFFEYLKHGQFNEATDLIINNRIPDINLMLYNDYVFVPTLRDLGTHWETGQMSVAEEHIISDVIDKLMTRLDQESLVQPNLNKLYSAALMLPGMEEHEFPLKMISEVFKRHGWLTYYIGKNIPISSLEDFFKKKTIHVLVLSVTLINHLNSCEALIRAIRSLDTDLQPKIIVGGNAITDEDFAVNQLGADYYFPSLQSLDRAMDDLENSLIGLLQNY
ncbi:helix-turn-helix domain-containing protein [Acidaminobacter hydrogenoformans]|uniref:B12 binding domain-containing protein n=1 Tax=Acidaminobacter hydrogenoformans DSM 2784 TaxID=1120920 RepID=A0A1G5S8T6_9FIRM|nr:helix-turn-helix domain-containing protein [Acidaminobacter hydrogenoformans]SCZ82131.1 B12 binding domain-containing protein [Acidaminobacter hydrogenoformans DSM 2784]